MSVYKRPGQQTYSYDFHHKGTRFSGQTECSTKREAQEFEKRRRKEIEAQTADLSKPMTFAVASSLYWDEVGQHHRNQIDTERALAWLQEQIGRKTLISSISEADAARLVAKRRGEKVGAATVNRSVCEPLRAILRRARQTWKVPVQDIEWKRHILKEPQERIREASAKEEDALFASIRPDYAPALRFALKTGCRRAEIVGLKWAAVDFFNRQITVFGKGDKRRTIPMTKELYALLWDLKDDHKEAVFTYAAKRARDGRGRGLRYPITIEGFKTEWRRLKARVKIADYRFHDNRHTAATRLVRKTGSLRLAQRLLGHTDIKTTTRYAHVTTEDLRAGMEAADRTASPTKNPTTAEDGADNALKDKGNVL